MDLLSDNTVTALVQYSDEMIWEYWIGCHQIDKCSLDVTVFAKTFECGGVGSNTYGGVMVVLGLL